jgi:hypothetical protein
VEALPLLGQLNMLKEIRAWFHGEKTQPKEANLVPPFEDKLTPHLFNYKVEQMLLSLGKKPEEVAAALQAQGICGQRRNVFACPISNRIFKLIREQVSDGDLYVCVSTESYTVNWLPPQSDQGVLLARGQLPRAVSELIRRFDYGEEFQELEGCYDVPSHDSPH